MTALNRARERYEARFHPILLRLTPEQYAKVKAIMDRDGLTAPEVVRALLADALKSRI